MSPATTVSSISASPSKSNSAGAIMRTLVKAAIWAMSSALAGASSLITSIPSGATSARKAAGTKPSVPSDLRTFHHSELPMLSDRLSTATDSPSVSVTSVADSAVYSHWHNALANLSTAGSPASLSSASDEVDELRDVTELVDIGRLGIENVGPRFGISPPKSRHRSLKSKRFCESMSDCTVAVRRPRKSDTCLLDESALPAFAMAATPAATHCCAKTFSCVARVLSMASRVARVNPVSRGRSSSNWRFRA
mmetsp:Transcript_35870/g.107824  ORF Transcript_35870/g.107824 Transcript_35870/m.107824 type:complete len:251 (+) Transcript_35870:350-1102(+)